MKRIAALLSSLPALVVAQQNCINIEAATERLACYDKANNRPEPSSSVAAKTEATSKSTSPSWIKYFTIRDEGLPTSLPLAGPAFIGYTKNDGKEASLIKASVIYTGPALTHGGAGAAPFASFSVYRDLTAATPRNSIGGKLGLRSTLFDYAATGFAIDATGSIGTREDRIKKTATDNALVTGRFIVKGLATGTPFGSEGIPFQLVPNIGAGIDRLRSAPSGTATGQNRFVYGGATLSVWPAIVSNKLQITGRYQRLADVSTAAGIDKRHATYREISIDYYLFDPNDDKAVFQPIFSISRELGTDPLTAISGISRTTVGLKFKLN